MQHQFDQVFFHRTSLGILSSLDVGSNIVTSNDTGLC